jgi:TPR repeat protein
MYEFGSKIWDHTTGRQDETDEALSWMTKAAEKGEVEAMYRLAMILTAGGRAADPKGLFWLRKGAEAGDSNCMMKLANAYWYGYLDLEKDPQQFQYWMNKAMAIDKARDKVRGR